MSKTALAILVLGAAAVIWSVLMRVTSMNASAALELGKQYLGFATSLAGFLGIAVGGGSLWKGQHDLQAMTTTATGLSVTLAGGAMVGGDPLAAAAALVAWGVVGAAYVLKKF